MSHTHSVRDDPAHITPQEEVALGALDSMGVTTSADLAEALTEAQQYLPPHERIKTPVDARSAGQYLGLLRTRGLVDCDPPPLVPVARGRRRWWINDAGRATLKPQEDQ